LLLNKVPLILSNGFVLLHTHWI